PIRIHQDPALFREAVNYTAAVTGFSSRLIEKDYFCTVLLQHLAGAGCELVFKGGTCLAKVHAGFYRLSEDLDFVIPTPMDASRADRSRRAAAAKAAVLEIDERVSGLRVIAALTGANSSTQYIGVVGYASLLGRQEDTIKIEVGLREPLLTPTIRGEAQTLLRNPLSGSPLAVPLMMSCLSREETMAEKLRAALSRREVAIRDFYDIDYAVRNLKLRPLEPELVELVRRKMAVAGNDPVDVSPNRLAALRLQFESQLKAVLRPGDFAEFDLDRAFATVAEVAAELDKSR
ncbi:MAG: nucleotidyl transferase AbiEii/AbiGii toxin family protein, partial [Deltaproteobacteria bacterium]|nr:nucleotidyl transferase AbiEii/AbiGii toxin family protein [Deltaproteobacteria bacterium]